MSITLKRPLFFKDITVPSSKSALHRALIAAAFADRPTDLIYTGVGKDIEATCDSLFAMGAGLNTHLLLGTQTLVTTLTPIKTLRENPTLPCGESGSTLRFLLPIVSVLGTGACFQRKGRLPVRPLSPLAELLEENGLKLASDLSNGDLLLSGRLSAGRYTLPANVSSQFITGMLFALSLCDGPSTLTLSGEIESAPYIDMTAAALAAFGVTPLCSADGRVFAIPGRKACPFRSPGKLYIEGDFSGAAFPLAAGAIGPRPVCVHGLDLNSTQGDRAILSLLEQFGAIVERNDKTRCVSVSPAPLHGITIDAKQIPDLVPVLAVVAAAARGETVIKNAQRLRLKESDRLKTTAALLRSLGGEVYETEDGLRIVGGKPLHGGTVDGANDHRIVMSAAVAALLTDEAITITDADAVGKSYPTFFKTAIERLSSEE